MKNEPMTRRQFLTASLQVLCLGALSPVLAGAASGRPIAMVSVNGRGPLRFVFDTGAAQSAVSGQLVGELGLSVVPGSTVAVNGAHGADTKPAVHIDDLRCGALQMSNLQLAVLDRHALPMEQGLLGVEGIGGKCVYIDMARRQVSIAEAPAIPPGKPDERIPMLRHASGLLLIEVRLGSLGCTAIIDTGAEVSVGNLALQRALRHSTADSPAPSVTLLSDVNGTSRLVPLQAAPQLQIGGLYLPTAPVVIADSDIFSALGVHSHPALLLGMDRLGAVAHLILDIRRGMMAVTL